MADDTAESLEGIMAERPQLQQNESMVYEEEVPVIVRRRGCMLRVRITSFADDGEETETERHQLSVRVSL